MGASIVAGSFAHVYSGTSLTLGSAVQAGDVIIFWATSSGAAATTASDSTSTFTRVIEQDDGLGTYISIFTALAGSGYTPAIAVTGGAVSDCGVSAVAIRGLTSATPNTSNGTFSSTSPVTASVTNTVSCTAICVYANESVDDFSSFTSGLIQLNHDSSHSDASGYLTGISAGTYNIGVNVGGVAPDVIAVIMLPESGGAPSYTEIFGPLLLTNAATNIYTPPGSPVYDVIYTIHVVNEDSSPHTFSLYVGGSGATAAGTEVFYQYGVGPYGFYEFSGTLRLDATDYIVALADANNVLTITGLGIREVL